MAFKWTDKQNTPLTTSTPSNQLRKSIKAAAIGSAIGLGTLMSSSAMALKTDFGMEYRAVGFAASSDAFDTGAPGTSDTDTGFGHLIRVKANFLDEDTGISVYTSVELAGDRWVGDNHGASSPANPQAFNAGSRGDNVRLDLGYVQIPVGHTIFRVGRQATSYNNCFLVCDDRRDRLLMIQPLSETTSMVALYDRRQDSTPFANRDNGDMAALGLTGKLSENWNAGILYVQWMNNYEGPLIGTPADTYILSNVSLFSGYVSGPIVGDALKATLGFNYMTNGNVEGAVDEQYFTDKSPSSYLRLEGDAGVIDWGLQYVISRDGGLISPGFDTYSSLINNNPDSTQSPTSMYTMGSSFGYGRDGYDEDLIIGKLTWNVTDKFAITGAVGQLSIDNPTAGIDTDDDSMVYDLQFSYQVNKALRTWLSLGMLEKNKAGQLSGNGLAGPIAGTTFADDDVKAASLNMTVNF